MLDIELCNALSSFNSVKESISIADATKPDMPLVYVNKGFEKFSGYRREDVIGRNCRFLQGLMKDQQGIKEIRRAIENKEGCLVELVNFTSSGEKFINRLSLKPIFTKNGTLKYYIGLQNDVTVLRELEEKIATFVTLKAQD